MEQTKSKYDEALEQYNTSLSDREVREAVQKIIAEKVHENDTPEVKKFLFGSIELTTLKTTDSDVSVMRSRRRSTSSTSSTRTYRTWQPSAYIHALQKW